MCYFIPEKNGQSYQTEIVCYVYMSDLFSYVTHSPVVLPVLRATNMTY